MITTTNFCEEHDALMSRRRHRAFAVVGYAAVISVALVMGLVMFWLTYPYDVIDFYPEVHPLVNDQRVVIQGESFAYTFRYEKHMSIQPVISTSFVDGLRFQAEGIAPFLPVSKGVAIIEVNVPRTLPPGRYQLEISKAYRVNPLRTITIVNRTEKFIVIEPVRQD
jgi:hypothetical protein